MVTNITISHKHLKLVTNTNCLQHLSPTSMLSYHKLWSIIEKSLFLYKTRWWNSTQNSSITTVTAKVHRLIMMRFSDNWTFCTIYFLEHCIIPILAMICILLMCENSNYFPPCLFIFSSENLKFYQPWNQKSFETDMHPPGNKLSEISKKKKVHSSTYDLEHF